MNERFTVFVVDDDPGALESLRWMIEQAGFCVKAFASGRQFLDAYRPEKRGCLVLDVRMPEMSGLELQERLAKDGINLPIIFVTAHGDVRTCAQAFKAGAVDFLQKPVDNKTLLDRVRKALARGAERKEQWAAAEFAARMDRLTPSEKDVMEMLILGKNLKEIAAVNNVRAETIWKHRLAIHKKMGVENDVQLARLAAEWADERSR